MKDPVAFIPVTVEYIPEILEDGKVYISHSYKTAVHLCACGCKNKTVTPFQMGWEVTVMNGEVSIYPSIGNWNFPCRSHYWIKNNIATFE